VKVTELCNNGFMAIDYKGNSNLYHKGWLIPCLTDEFTLIRALSEKEWAQIPMTCLSNNKDIKCCTCSDFREIFVKKVSKSESHRGVLGLCNVTFSFAMQRLHKMKLLNNVKSFFFKVFTNSLPTNSHGFGPSKACSWCKTKIGDYDHTLDECALALEVKSLYNKLLSGKYNYSINLNKGWHQISKRDLSLSIRWIVYWNIWKYGLSYNLDSMMEPMNIDEITGSLVVDLSRHCHAFKWE